MRINRFVLDVNIWVSCFITKREFEMVDFVANRKATLFVCNELIIEFKRVLSYPHLEKYKINIKEAVALMLSISVNYDLEYPIKNYILSDSDDDYVIALALQTNSGYVSSGDEHILKEKLRLERKFPKLKIITYSELRKLF